MTDERPPAPDEPAEAAAPDEGTGISTAGPAGGSGGTAFDESRPEHHGGRPTDATEERPSDDSSGPASRPPMSVRDEIASGDYERRG